MHRRRGRAAGVRGPPCDRANPVGLVPAIGALRDDALASAIITAAAASVPEASHTVICLKYLHGASTASHFSGFSTATKFLRKKAYSRRRARRVSRARWAREHPRKGPRPRTCGLQAAGPDRGRTIPRSTRRSMNSGGRSSYSIAQRRIALPTVRLGWYELTAAM